MRVRMPAGECVIDHGEQPGDGRARVASVAAHDRHVDGNFEGLANLGGGIAVVRAVELVDRDDERHPALLEVADCAETVGQAAGVDQYHGADRADDKVIPGEPEPVLAGGAEQIQHHLLLRESEAAEVQRDGGGGLVLHSRKRVDTAADLCQVLLSREKTLYRMLYETAARTAEILSLNVEELDLENRRAPLTSKGGDTEWVYWDAGTARLLPRILRLPDGSVRAQGPLFLADRRPVPARRPGPEHICPYTDRPRLGYDRVRVLMDKHLGLDPHQLRHSAATHLGEQKVPLQLIMAKTRHKNPRTAMRYTRPGSEAVAEITGILAPPRRTH